jgi:hypothetical protein
VVSDLLSTGTDREEHRDQLIMNCLSHAYRFLHDPYLAAGTCVPDWLGMVDRKTRVRRNGAWWIADAAEETPATRSIARGIVQHLEDDEWFHRGRAFVELSMLVGDQIAECLAGDRGIRSGFLGHVLVELLLDSAVAERHPGALDDYYRVMAEVDPRTLQDAVNQIAAKPTDRLEGFMPRYLKERFLYDYLEDRTLLRRLNGVARRVDLPELPDSMLGVIGAARPLVRRRQDELLDVNSCG